MKNSVKDLWVKHLNDGSYRLGRNNAIRWTVDGELMYDPIGVLCDLSVRAKQSKWKQCKLLGMTDLWWIDNENLFGPSEKVINFAGFDVNLGDREDNVPLFEGITLLWDERGKSPLEIVNFIEEYWEAL